MEIILLQFREEGFFGAVDGDILELQMLLRPGPEADAQGRQEYEKLSHSVVELVIQEQI